MNTPFALLDLLVSRQLLAGTRAKDLKTALRRLSDATQTPIDAFDLLTLERTYKATLQHYFATSEPPPSAYTQRNVLQNLHQFYRLLFEHGLLMPSRSTLRKKPYRRQVLANARDESPYRHRTSAALTRYYYPMDLWPKALRQPFEAFCLGQTFKVRESTQENYRNHMTAYVSYGLSLDSPRLTTWDQVFETDRLTRFIIWHAKRVDAGRISYMGLQVARLLRTIANATHRPEADALHTLIKDLPAVRPLHDKQAAYHRISAQELESVGLVLLNTSHQPLRGNAPFKNERPGLLRATTNQTALLLRLLWRVPLRSRNIREMELGKNLFRDAQGIWTIRFMGDELKVDQRRGKINIFQARWPDELVTHLDEYLTIFRPRFPHADISSLVFPNRQGVKQTHAGFYYRISQPIYIHLRKRLFPHLVRSLWTDSWIESGGDVATGAYMLNNAVTTMLEHYHDFYAQSHVEKAYEFNQKKLKSAGM
jgi:hypothetical protein